jgi:hypothetical protein
VNVNGKRLTESVPIPVPLVLGVGPCNGPVSFLKHAPNADQVILLPSWERDVLFIGFAKV